MSTEPFWDPSRPAERHDDPAFLAAHYDPYDPELSRGRFLRVAAEIGKCPIVHSDAYEPNGFSSVAGYRELESVMKRPRQFSSFPATVPPFGNPRPMLPGETDPPAHMGYRRVLREQFSRKLQESHAETYRGFARESLAQLPEDGRADIVELLCGPLPLRALSFILGVPERDHSVIQRIGHDLVRKDGEGGAERAGEQLYAYLATRLAEVRAHPGDDVISDLCRAEIDGQPLTDDQILDYGFGLVPAGFETTASTLSYIFLLLAEHPDLQERLRARPDLIPSAIEECLRYVTPVRVMGRTVTEDVNVGGRAFHPGERIHLNFAGANHDATVFDRPEEIDIDRKPNRHVSFGLGEHLCLGIHMARALMRVTIEESLARMDQIRLADPEMIVETPGTTWAITRLPIEYTLRVPAGAVS